MSLTRDALSIDEVVALLTSPAFSPIATIDEAVSSADEHTAAVELVTRLDAYSQDTAAALARALNELQRAEKRLQYQVDLLKSDVSALASKQEIVGSRVLEAMEAGLHTPALKELSDTELIRSRIVQVQTLVKEAEKYDEAAVVAELDSLIAQSRMEDAEALVTRQEQIAAIFNGTIDEAAHARTVATLQKRLRSAAVASPSDSYGFNELLGKFQRLTK